ncbi:SusC/RagA family TonB-linked outer membrane protein [Chitinophaga sp. CF118]|uniref:SusC/RagA family TonB-linked outer membrane protein n=1 Tax=Chitinophaga sp. CF118 TaxID=1884367 RepID=UPI0015A58B0B|nr:SusC/RagA family TonB-linked outer membrane protein [Chitinophaga sp. CF118]
MKLMAVLLLAGVLHVSATSLAQTVTYSARNVALEKAFAEIQRQTGYSFVYRIEWMKEAKKVDISVHNSSIQETLGQCFRNQPFSYEIIDRTVVLKLKEKAAPAPRNIDEPVVSPPSLEISGQIIGEAGPLGDVTVQVKRTGKGIISDASGRFTLRGLEAGDVLLISAIGHETREVQVKEIPQKDNKGFLYLQLKAAVSKLDEVQVLAYGQSTTRRLSTGSISRVTGEEIAKQPVNNVLQALAGRVTGLSISQASGLAGGDVTFQVRGQNSVNTDPFTSAPLVIVDGVPYPNVPIILPSVSGTGSSRSSYNIIGPGGYGNPLYSFNPNDIESVEILKDADATAIYGSRAGNGVMLITTKKGKQGKTKVEINVNTGIAINTRRVDLLTTPEYIALRKEAFKNSGISPTAISAPDLFTWDSTKTIDWQDRLLGNTAHTTDVNVSMSGGAGGTSFLISGNYHYENSIFPDRRGSEKAGVHYSLNHTANSGKFSIALTGMVNSTNTRLPTGSYGTYAYSMPPNFEAFDAAGNLKWDWNGNNPYAAIRTSYSNKTFSLTSNLSLRYNILPGLDAKASIGYTRVETDQQQLNPKSAANPGNTFFLSSNLLSTNRSQSLNFEPQLQYVRSISRGTLNVMAGATIMKTVAEMPFSVNAYNFSSDAYINNIALAGTVSNNTTYNAFQYASFFGSTNFNWQNRYIVNGSFRRDGSSRFGSGHRYGNFGAIGAAWLFSNESFADHLTFLSHGKLRGSIGWVGSDNVSGGNYAYLPLYTNTSYGYNGTAGLVPSMLENPDFGWESTSKLEGALELGFLKNRVLATVAWYRNRTGNQLIGWPVSTQTGFSSYTANLNNAVVQNTGWEIELNTVNISNKHFRWTSSFNITIPNNKLLKFDGIENTAFASASSPLQVGKPLNSNFAIPFLGLDSMGRPQYADVNKNGKIDYFSGAAIYGKGDKVYIGKSYAGYYGGFTNTFSYRNWQLDFTLQYTGDLQKRNYLASISQPGLMYNVPRKAISDIRAKGLDKAFIKASSTTDFFYYVNYANASYMDASFIRLTNAALSYNLSERPLKLLHLVGLRIYMQAQNLFVISNYHGFDPESGAVSVPPLLRVTAGLQCTF